MWWVISGFGSRMPLCTCSISRGKSRFTDAWFALMVMPLFTTFPIGTRVSVGPYTPTLETIIHAIDDDDPSRPEEPGASGRHDAYWTGPENHDGVPGLDAAHLGRLISRWHHVGEHHGVVRVHVSRDDRGAHIGIRDADVFRLSAVVAARCVRVAEDATNSGGLGVGLVAVPIQPLPA